VFVGSRLTGVGEVCAPNMFGAVAPILAPEAVKAYESGAPEAFARFSQSSDEGRTRQLFLLDGFYKDVLSQPLTNDGLPIAHAAKSGQLIVLRGQIAVSNLYLPQGAPTYGCST
jgi:hypothetical protein